MEQSPSPGVHCRWPVAWAHRWVWHCWPDWGVLYHTGTVLGINQGTLETQKLLLRVEDNGISWVGFFSSSCLRGRESERALPPMGSHPRCPQWLGTRLGLSWKLGTQSRTPRIGDRELSSCAFTADSPGSWSEQPGQADKPRLSSGGCGHLTCSAKCLPPPGWVGLLQGALGSREASWKEWESGTEGKKP